MVSMTNARHRCTRWMDVPRGLKSRPGTYAFIVVSATNQTVEIGRLGKLQVRHGYYLYVGSAFGPGGLRARIAHHMRPSRRPHWHVDYLRTVTDPYGIWYSYDEVPREHLWAEAILRTQNATVPVRGFGSSDCSCPSHLFFRTSPPCIQAFRARLRGAQSKYAAVLVKELA